MYFYFECYKYKNTETVHIFFFFLAAFAKSVSMTSMSGSEPAANAMAPSLPTPPLPDIKPQISETGTSDQSALPLPPLWAKAKQAKLPTHKAASISQAVVRYLVHDLRPYSTVQSPAFKSLLHELEPRYTVPSRQTISERLVPAWHEMEKGKLQGQLDSASAVGLTADGWTSRAIDPYLTVTAHFLSGWEMQSKVLQTQYLGGSHTGEALSAELTTVLKKWNIDGKTTGITVDNAANMGKACVISGIEIKMGCFAHTLHLAALKASDVGAVRSLLSKIRPVIAFMHRSHLASQLFREKHAALELPQHNLIIDVKTRWNSTYLMVERYIEQHMAVMATFGDEKLKSQLKHAVDLTDFSIRVAEEYINLMREMYKATLAMCSEKHPTVSIVLPMLFKLKNHFTAHEDDSPFLKEIKDAVLKNLSLRYQDPALSSFLEESSCLDPRTKNNKCLVGTDAWSRLKEKLVEKMPKAQPVIVKQESAASSSESDGPPPSKKCLLASLLDWDDEEPEFLGITNTNQEMAEKELAAYRNMSKLPFDKDPMGFWKEKCYELPYLTALAKQYLVLQATSVASERVFSTAGDIVSAERNCLQPEQVDALIFLKKNAFWSKFQGILSIQYYEL